jgi:hypothetical protein
MKKLIPFAFLLFFCWQFIGAGIYFKTSLHQIRSQAKIMVKKSTTQCQTITLTHQEYQELTWIKKNEFKWGKHLFDVRTVNKLENTVQIVCLMDLLEKELFEKYTLQLEKNHPDKHSPSKQILWQKVLSTFFLRQTIEPYSYPLFRVNRDQKTMISRAVKCSLPHLQTIFIPPIYHHS